MRFLKELVQVVNQNKVKQIELLSLRKHQGSKINALYRLLSKEAGVSDEEAFTLLYPESNSRSAYNNLKGHLRDRLINTLFFIDTSKSNYSDRQTAYFEAHKEYAAAQILLAKNAHHSARTLLAKLLKRSLHYDFTELSWMTARILRLEYSTRSGDQEKFEEYQQIVEQVTRVIDLENQAEYYYGLLILNFVNNKSPKPELAQQAKRYVAELAPQLRYCDAYKFHFFVALIELFQYTCLNLYLQVIPICDRYLAFFADKAYAATTPIQLLYHHKLVAYMQLGQFEEAHTVALQSQGITEAGTFNWFNNLEYLLLLSMHTQRFSEAYTYFTQATGHKQFKSLPDYVRELWDIYRAYLHLLIDAGKLSVGSSDKNFTAFRLNRFLNNLTIYNKDKSGMNVAVMIVQILFYIQKGKEDQCIDRIETMKKYCDRHLLEQDASRSFHFIQLLITAAKMNFQYDAVIRATAPHLRALEQSSAAFSTQFHKIEIIPYEVLWEMFLHWLAPSQQARRQQS